MHGSEHSRSPERGARRGRCFRFSPDPLPLEALERQITDQAARLSSDTYRWLCLIGEFDTRGGWVGWGMQSCAHWLAWKHGLSLRTAREQLRVAHALETLPLIDEAFGRGELSYSKVRAITRVAEPRNEEEMLEVARSSSAAHLELLARGYRRLEERAMVAENNARHAERRLHYGYEDDGSLVIRVQLPPEQGAVVLKALEAAVQEIRQEEYERGLQMTSPADSDADTGETGGARDPEVGSAEHSGNDGSAEHLFAAEILPARRADACVRMAERFLERDARPLSGGERCQVVLHADAAVLADAAETGRCELEDGTALAVETARRLACDAELIRLLETADGEPLNVGRKTRSIPPAIRRALEARDGGCRFPGCTRWRYVDGHHVVHWARGGETRLDNLVLLCRDHHRKVHEGGFAVEAGGAEGFVFRRPDGVAIEPVPGAPPVDTHEEAGSESRLARGH